MTAPQPATRYAAFLRGVNVGGVNLKMRDVASVFNGIGLHNVKTVLASGNVLFDSPDAAGPLKGEIEAALSAAFGYPARVHLIDLTELRAIADRFPFPADREGWHPYVIFAMDDRAVAALAALGPALDPEVESLAAGDSVVYWTVLRGRTLDSVVGKATATARYKPMVTTRNLRTLRKLLA
ncbi:MAG: DUF1697 domain-containing protein [Microbacteriaceae bacterium]